MTASVPTESGKLDLIRSFAVLLVVFSHLPISQKIFDSLLGQHVLHVQAMGILGVGIFFVHTCFVLMLSLERQTIRQGKADLAKTFFIRRLFRIYPLSIVTVLIVFAVGWQTGGGSADYSTLTSNLLLIQNFTGQPSNPAPLWSLPFEVQMYLFLPALYLLVDCARDKATLCVLAIWAGCVVLVLATWAIGQNYHIIKYLPAFLPGVAAYSLRARTATLPASLPTIYILLMAFIFSGLVARGGVETVLLWPVCLCLGLLIPFSKEITSPIIKVTSGKIAKYSYGIYLVHDPLIGFAFNSLKDYSPAIQWMSFLVGTASLAYAAYHLIEKPGIDFGVRLAGTPLRT